MTPRPVGRPTVEDEAVVREAKRAALTSVTLLNVLAATFLGEDCRMNDAERQLIFESGQEVLESMSFETAQAVAKWAAPATLAGALGGWVARIVRTKREQAGDMGDDGPGPRPPEEPSGPTPDDGIDRPIEEPELEPIGELVGDRAIVAIPLEQLQRKDQTRIGGNGRE